MSGFDRSSGLSSSSTAAKNASRSRWPTIIVPTLRTEPDLVTDCYLNRTAQVTLCYLRLEALDDPRLALAPVTDAVVQTVVMVNPELVRLGEEPIAAPVRRPREFFRMGGVELGVAPVELL